jgi:hypothetical protein
MLVSLSLLRFAGASDGFTDVLRGRSEMSDPDHHAEMEERVTCGKQIQELRAENERLRGAIAQDQHRLFHLEGAFDKAVKDERERCTELLIVASLRAIREVKEERERCARDLKDRIDTRLNACLCEMKEGYDDSIVGFNEAWDIVREIFAAAIRKGEGEREYDPNVAPCDDAEFGMKP